MLCREKDMGRRFALKVFAKPEDAVGEITILRILSSCGGHPSILCMVESESNPPFPWIALPFVPGITLHHALHVQTLMTKNCKLQVLSQMVDALAWLHRCCLAHMDIKSSNMLWEPRTVRLYVVDFGMSIETETFGRPKGDLE